MPPSNGGDNAKRELEAFFAEPSLEMVRWPHKADVHRTCVRSPRIVQALFLSGKPQRNTNTVKVLQPFPTRMAPVLDFCLCALRHFHTQNL